MFERMLKQRYCSRRRHSDMDMPALVKMVAAGVLLYSAAKYVKDELLD